MKVIPGHSLLEVISSLSIVSLLFVLSLSLLGRLTGMQAPPEQLLTRTLVQNWLAAPPDWDMPTAERWVRGRYLTKNLILWEENEGLCRIEVSAYRNGVLLAKARRWVRKESYRRP